MTSTALIIHPAHSRVAAIFRRLLRRDMYGPGAPVATPAVIYLPASLEA